MKAPHPSAEKIVSSNSQGDSDTQLHGRKLILARTVWAIIVVTALALWLADFPLNYAQYLTVCTKAFCPNQLATPDMVRALHAAGLSLQFYAVYNVILEILVVLMFCGIGFIIAWRKSHDWMALLVSLGLVTLSTSLIDFQLLATDYPITQVPGELISFVALAITSLFFYLFPNGHFVPRWTRWLALLVVLFTGASTFFPNSPFNTTTPTLLGTVLALAFLGSLLFAQVYRYLRVSNPVQRQQTKWIVFGVIATMIYFLAILILAIINPAFQEARSLTFLFADASYI